jgi:hypothetical protein
LPWHAHVGECFADVVGPTFKVDGRAPPLLTARGAWVWDFTLSSSSSAVAPCSLRSFASVAPPQLAPPNRLRLHRYHVELDAIQRVL